MNVSQLIAKLQEMVRYSDTGAEHLEVKIYDADSEDWETITGFEHSKDVIRLYSDED